MFFRSQRHDLNPHVAKAEQFQQVINGHLSHRRPTCTPLQYGLLDDEAEGDIGPFGQHALPRQTGADLLHNLFVRQRGSLLPNTGRM